MLVPLPVAYLIELFSFYRTKSHILPKNCLSEKCRSVDARIA